MSPVRLPVLASLVLAPQLAVPSVSAQVPADMDATVERFALEITALPHRIHQSPEHSSRDVETAVLVAEHLEALGLEARSEVAHTGVVGVLRGDRHSSVVVVRADMDALPVTEDTGLPLASTNRATYGGQEVGAIHACGYDVQIVGRHAHGTQPQKSVNLPTMTADDSAMQVGIRAMTSLVPDHMGGDGG